jgi:hypothetical protein
MADFDEDAMGDLEFPDEVDPGKIPTFAQLPLGRFEGEIKGWIEDKIETAPRNQPDAPKTAKAVVKVQFSLTTTPDGRFLGLPHTETFWIGSDADPLAKSPATWMANAGRVMKLLKKAKVATSKGLKFRNMMDASVGSHVMLEVKENKKNGRRMIDFLSIAEKPLEYFDAPVGNPGVAPVSAGGSDPLTPPDVFDNE